MKLTVDKMTAEPINSTNNAMGASAARVEKGGGVEEVGGGYIK